MKKILIVVLITTILTGCLNEPMSVEKTGKNDKFEIEFLFEKDGIKVYRFYDAMQYHYFTTNGETMSNQTEGKTTREERIPRIGDDEYYQLVGELKHEIK